MKKLTFAMRRFNKFIFVFIVLVFSLQPGCKKQPKCGCDGDVRFPLVETSGTIIYNEETGYAQFQPSDVYSTFEICDAGSVMDLLTPFEQGETVLVSGDAYDDCYKMVNPYAYANYMLRLTEIKKDQFDN